MRRIWRRRVAGFALCLLAVFAIQWSFLSMKTREIPAELYSQNAVDLAVSTEWRTGYVTLRHGAVLVKTRNVEGPAPTSDEPPDEDVREIMARELQLVPVKTALELTLYVALLVYLFFGMRWVSSRLSGWARSLIQQLAQGTMLWMVGWTALFLPVLWGYGPPLFLNWLGPGAASASTALLSPGNGLTVSYRSVIEFFLVYPLLFASMFGSITDYLQSVGLTVRVHDDIMLWVIGLLFYGAAGLVVSWLRHLRRLASM